MATDERNFRSSYYEKVGCRNVEEKKSIDILFKDKPLDIQKLKQYCLRFTVPMSHRILLWKVLTGVTPRYQTNTEFVRKQRVETYEGLLRAVQVMQLAKNDMPKHVVLLLLWLLETGNLKYDLQIQLDTPMFIGLIAISESMMDMIDGDVDAYWVGRGFFQLTMSTVSDNIPRLISSTRHYLEREDPELFTHIAFDVIPLDKWFHCLFAGVLHESALEKIWDKLLGGSVKLLPFVAVVLLTTLRRPLLATSSDSPLSKEFSGLSDETSEVISNKAIDLWQQYGSPLIYDNGRWSDA